MKTLATGAMASMAAAARRRRPKTFVPQLDHAAQALELHGDRAARVANAAVATAQLFADGVSSTSLNELMDMGVAIHHRAAKMQLNWARNWMEWLSYAQQIDNANTMTKLAEREGNTVAQAMDLISGQVQDVLGLMETVEIGYLYWVTQKTSGESA